MLPTINRQSRTPTLGGGDCRPQNSGSSLGLVLAMRVKPTECSHSFPPLPFFMKHSPYKQPPKQHTRTPRDCSHSSNSHRRLRHRQCSIATTAAAAAILSLLLLLLRLPRLVLLRLHIAFEMWIAPECKKRKPQDKSCHRSKPWHWSKTMESVTS